MTNQCGFAAIFSIEQGTARSTNLSSSPALRLALTVQVVSSHRGSSTTAAEIRSAWFLAWAATFPRPITRARTGFCADAPAISAWQHQLWFIFMRHAQQPRFLNASSSFGHLFSRLCANWPCFASSRDRRRLFFGHLCLIYWPSPTRGVPLLFCSRRVSCNRARSWTLCVSVSAYISFCFLVP